MLSSQKDLTVTWLVVLTYSDNGDCSSDLGIVDSQKMETSAGLGSDHLSSREWAFLSGAVIFFYYIIVFIKYINYLCPLVQISSSISNLSQVFMLKNLQKSCKNRVLRNHISFTFCHTLFILLSLCVCIYYFY